MLLSFLARGHQLVATVALRWKPVPGKLLFGNCCNYETHQTGCLVAIERKLPFSQSIMYNVAALYSGQSLTIPCTNPSEKSGCSDFFIFAFLILGHIWGILLKILRKWSQTKSRHLVVAEIIMNKPKYKKKNNWEGMGCVEMSKCWIWTHCARLIIS